jgi:DNA-binding response OmpR family regulator
MKILLVESDPSVRRTLGLLLRELGHDVLCSEKSEDTVPLLDPHWPDAVVMNYFQDGQTAIQLCDQIVNLFGEMPPILIHSSAPEHRFFALRFKNVAFLTSPFSPEELQHSIDSINTSEISLTG